MPSPWAASAASSSPWPAPSRPSASSSATPPAAWSPPACWTSLPRPTHPTAVARSLAAEFITGKPALTFLYQQIQGLNPERGEDGVISGFRREDGRQEADFFGWQTPTLLIVGDQDAIFPPAAISEVQKTIPGSRMEIAAGTAHSAHYEKADEFNSPPGDVLRHHPRRAARPNPRRLGKQQKLPIQRPGNLEKLGREFLHPLAGIARYTLPRASGVPLQTSSVRRYGPSTLPKDCAIFWTSKANFLIPWRKSNPDTAFSIENILH